MSKMMSIGAVLIILSILIPVAGQIALKKGINLLQGSYATTDFLKPWLVPKMMLTSPLIFVGLICYAAGFIVWLAALSKFDVSFMYPLLSLAYVLVAIGAFVFLKENITLYRWLGIALVTAGSFLLLRSA